MIRTGKAGGAHFDEDTRGILRDNFPNGKCAAFYGSTMILGGARTREGRFEDDPVNHDAQSPCIRFPVIDSETGRPVPYSERGQVVMNHISTIMFVPKNLERETALRVAGPEGHLPAHTPKPFLIGRHSGGAADAAAGHHLVGNEAFRETNPGAAAVRHRRTRTSAMRDMKARARTGDVSKLPPTSINGSFWAALRVVPQEQRVAAAASSRDVPSATPILSPATTRCKWGLRSLRTVATNTSSRTSGSHCRGSQPRMWALPMRWST
jgi:hypothetical protein